MTPRLRRKFTVTRDSVLFVFGLAGIVYETVVMQTERPTLLVLFGACIGLPAFLRKDEQAQQSETKQPQTPADTEGAP